jgi:tryptophan synthase alpha chain
VTKLGVYWTIGDYGRQTTIDIARELIAGGVKLLELGLPFSDPLLDGPLIQESHHRVTASGFTYEDAVGCLSEICAIAKQAHAQVSVMTASQLLYDPLRLAKLPAVDGILVTDLNSRHPSPIQLPSPRVFFVSQQVVLSEDFRSLPNESLSMIYLTRLQGITGDGQSASSETAAAVQKLKTLTSQALPIWLGFGVTSVADVKACGSYGAAGAIIGTAFVRHIANAAKRAQELGTPLDARSAVRQWLEPFKAIFERA